jgi:hypothetical protein
MASETDIEQRVETITEWIISGMGYSDTVAKTCGEWKVCKRTAESYIARANEALRTIRANRKDSMIEMVTQCLISTYQSARNSQDHSAATGAIRELVKLLGLAEPDKTEVKHDATDPIKALLGEIVNAPDKAQ